MAYHRLATTDHMNSYVSPSAKIYQHSNNDYVSIVTRADRIIKINQTFSNDPSYYTLSPSVVNTISINISCYHSNPCAPVSNFHATNSVVVSIVADAIVASTSSCITVDYLANTSDIIAERTKMVSRIIVAMYTVIYLRYMAIATITDYHLAIQRYRVSIYQERSVANKLASLGGKDLSPYATCLSVISAYAAP